MYIHENIFDVHFMLDMYTYITKLLLKINYYSGPNVTFIK